MPRVDDHLKSSNFPSQYNSIAKFDRQVNVYVHNCRIMKIMPTFPGLAIFLGFNSRIAMNKWIDINKRFKPSVERAHDLLEDSGIQIMTDPGNKNGNGSHRYMSKAFGYNEKIDIDSTVTTKVIRLPGKVKAGDPVKKPVKKKKPVSNNKT